MSNPYNASIPRFQAKMGADEKPKTHHNGNMIKPLTLEETTQFLGISRETLNQLFNKRLLRSFHIGRRRFVSAEALCAFIKEREQEEL